MKNIFRTAAFVALSFGLMFSASSCEPYDEKPPKTDKAVKYALPDPVYPETEEIQALKEIRKEHNENV